MKKLALITKTVKIESGDTGNLLLSNKKTTIRFLGIAVYKSTIILN